MDTDVGLAWYTPPDGQPIYLVVDRGRVTACTPYAEKWALGRTAGQIRQRQRADDATVVWIPLSAPPATFNPATVGTTPIRRWAWSGGHHGGHLTIGRIGNGGWYVKDTNEPHAWRYNLAGEAWAECDRRMAGDDRWLPTYAAYGPRGERVEDPDLPEELQAYLRDEGRVDAAE